MSPIPPRRRAPRFSGAASSSQADRGPEHRSGPASDARPARAPAGGPSRHPFREEARAPAHPHARPDRHEGPRRQAAPAPERRDLRPVLFMPCAMGVESLLQEELAPLLAHLPLSVVADRGGVRVHSNQPAGRAPIDLPFDFESSLAATVVEAVFIINLHSRLAQRVLWRVALGPYASEDQIYHLARCVDWNDWITPEHTLRVDVTARHSPLQSLNFAGLRIKDAVCDALRDQHGERPSVDLRHPDLQLQLHLDENAAYLYVDTSGEALFKRGWREDTGEAPLKETLAAAMLAAAGWKGRAEDGALLDPCCGSGTIAIEAAQIACGMAAGMLRRFAFEQLSPFAPHEAIWIRLIELAKAQVRQPSVRIYTGDVSFRMTDFATRNAERAGVLHAIEFKTADALQRMPPEATGVMMFNPPYGERIDPKGTGHGGLRESRAVREDFTERDAGDFFSRMSSHWKKHYPGWTAWVLSPDMKLPSAMRLKESRRTVMFNGPIECRLFRFDLVAGSLRTDTAQSGPGGDNAATPRRPQIDPDED